MHKKYLIIILFFVTVANGYSQNDCVNAIVVCGNSGFKGLTVTGIGKQELDDKITCNSHENNSVWLQLYISTSGTLGFTLKPESSDIIEDFDFFIFGPNSDCNNLENAIRCSTTNPEAIGQNNNWTGMNDTETDVSEGPGSEGNSFIKWMDVTARESYFLVIDRPIGISNFSIEWSGTATLNEPPTLDAIMDLKECDTDGVLDNSTHFDLTQNDAVISGKQINTTVTYHVNSNDALTGLNKITNPASFVNTSNPQTVYARITKATTGCFNYDKFALSISTPIDVPNAEVALCDDDTDGDDTNGQATFNFDTVTSKLFNGQDISTLTYNYYLTQNDANTATNPLPKTLHTSSRSVFIRVTTNIQSCFTIKEIWLRVKAIPVRKTNSLVQCDTEIVPDGITLFNLLLATTKITDSNSSLSVAYYENATDAQNSSNSLTKYTNTSNLQNIVAKITSATTGCSSNSTLSLVVNTTPTLNAVIKRCDVLGQENGIAIFDLTKNDFALAPSATITYYETIQDALLKQSAITPPEKYTNTGHPYTHTLFARIEKDNDCTVINTIKLIVDKLPNINTKSEKNLFVCSNLPEFFITIDASVLEPLTTVLKYYWHYNGTILPPTTYSIDVNKEGIYTVDVFNEQGCFKTRTIEVSVSSNAKIETVEVIDLTDINTVTITVSGQGDYEYSLDNPTGAFVTSNVFVDVPLGIHTVFVNDKNGCGIISKEVAVIGAPRFFTPNGDGHNDYWNVKGINTKENSKSIIYIFNRYGKLLKQIFPNSDGWNGTLHNQPLPADDYWFTLRLEDGREAKGHFSLKR